MSRWYLLVLLSFEKVPAEGVTFFKRICVIGGICWLFWLYLYAAYEGAAHEGAP